MTFKKRSHLRKHIAQIHRASKKQKEKCLKRSPCPLCGKEYTLSNMNTHIKTHNHSYRKICHICGKQCRNSSQFRNHFARIHLDVCSVQCDLCGKVYRKKESLRIHKMRDHNQRRYNCSYCSAKLKSSTGMKKTRINYSYWRVNIQMCIL